MTQISLITPSPCSTCKSKKRLNSKNKGNVFERQVAKQLSLWYSVERNDAVFYRTASSGTRGTQRFKRGQSAINSAGDLSFLHSEGEPFLQCCAVEIKSGYPAATINRSLSSTKPELLSFFTQAYESAHQAGVPCWMVIHKLDHQPPLLYCNVFLLTCYIQACCRYRDIPIPKSFDFSFFPFRVLLTSEKIGEVDTQIAILKFDDFLTLDPAFFRPEHLFSK